VPHGGLAVVATGGKVAVYRNITSSSPVLVTTLTASNFVTVTNSETQNYQSGVFINKDYIVLENFGRTVGDQNQNSQNGANTYAIDFFDLNNNFARTTYMPGFKIAPNTLNGFRSQFVESMGISEDSKKYIPIGQDVAELASNPQRHRVKYRDERP
jgi:hypothetical protein